MHGTNLPLRATRRPRRETPRLEMLRPLVSKLSVRDYTLLEGHLMKLAAQPGTDGPLLPRLIRTKLADAQIVLGDDVEPDLATANSRLVFIVDETTERSCVLRHWEHELDDRATLPVRSLLGATLLGMKTGQSAPLLRQDGSFGFVHLLDVAIRRQSGCRNGRI